MGARLTMKDSNDKTLLDLVIGKKASDPADARYVRRPGEATVYSAVVRINKLSARFDDWIERNLLKISTQDIRRLHIRDHMVDVVRHTLANNGELMIGHEDASGRKWKLLKDEAPQAGNPQMLADRPGSRDQELNGDKLDALRTALEDLKIVGVKRKPAGLSSDLKTAKHFWDNVDGMRSLAAHGFHGAMVGNRVEVFCNSGELRVLMKDGLEYVLRFGEVAGTGEKDEPRKKDVKDNLSGPGPNRYLFVTTEFNADSVPKPSLEALPKDAAPGDRVAKENQQKEDEYQSRLKAGRKRAEELNAQFADWYYVIPDDVFRKIHLTRTDIVQRK